jgi:hypothetical protein
VSFLNPQITITPVGNTLVTQNIPGARYEWTDCNNPSVILGTQSVFSPPSTGLYKVYVVWSYSASCASGAGCFQYNGPLSVDENEKFSYKLFPNPVKESFEIITDEIIKKVSIYNALGQKLKTFNNQNRFNLEYLPSGVYNVFIETENKKSFQKIIKE